MGRQLDEWMDVIGVGEWMGRQLDEWTDVTIRQIGVLNIKNKKNGLKKVPL
jgi:hypothetical protein